MALPGFRKRRAAANPEAGVKDGPLPDDQALAKRATKTRRNAIIFTSFCYLVAVVFLILVEIGNTSSAKVPGELYFFKLDLSDIMASSVSSSLGTLSLTNSIARTLGLHDFYQVGLWSFCEGYMDEGITKCSTPTSLYWFNPVEILQGELLAGASIALPSEVNTILTILRITSQVMFGFFLAGLVLDFVLMLLAPIVLYSRWWSFPFSVFAFLAAIMVIAAAAVATAMALVFQYALTSQVDLNIKVDIGTKMWAFMWIGAGFTFLAFLIHAGLGCCCTSRRDLRTGRKKGRNLATVPGTGSEKSQKGYNLPKFGRKSAGSDY
ncbi:putative SUR7/PalI family-domain-containing protein [Seiridium cardinale]|uniref:SUR7/PalI family-domain-containing protein n=1 Tax=Seiridium cardinale TaxID=138064 RepID=A0ABR2Y7E2_9PEZI